MIEIAKIFKMMGYGATFMRLGDFAGDCKEGV